MLTKNKDNKGFTLIEVVIVMAIGALIILVVLQAVSSAQINQRDSARRSEASRISAALETRAANNGGVYPTQAQFASFLAQYEQALSAKGWVRVTTCGAQTSTSYNLTYAPTTTANRDYTLTVCLERGTASIR